MQSLSTNDVNAVEQEVASYEDAIVGRVEDPTKLDDAISALVNLGYQRLEAYQVVNKVNVANPDADVSKLIRLALKEFAPKE
jgi:Holliday junction resolvasome RuvABC DNA-binding subunit